MEKSDEDVEWSNRKAEVEVVLAEQMQEHGLGPVLAACSSFAKRYTYKMAKEDWLSEEREASASGEE